MEEKFIILLELTSDDVALTAAMADLKPSKLWDELKGRTVTIKPEDIEDKEARMGLTLIAIGAAMGQIKK